MQRMGRMSPEPQRLGPPTAARGEQYHSCRHLADTVLVERGEGFEEGHKDRVCARLWRGCVQWLAAGALGSRVRRALMSSHGVISHLHLLPRASHSPNDAPPFLQVPAFPEEF